MRARIHSETKLCLLLVALLLAVSLPAWFLFRQASRQLDLEVFRAQQLAAEDVVRRIDAVLGAAIAVEEGRPFVDYAFATTVANNGARFVQRSPLSALTYAGALPGVIGYFVVDGDGRLTTPLLPGADADPGDYGISAAEQIERREREDLILGVLGENRLVRSEPTNLRQGLQGNLRRQEVPAEPAVADAIEQRSEEAETAREEVLVTASRAPRAVPVLTERDDAASAVRGQAAFDELSAGRDQDQGLAAAAVANAGDLSSDAEAAKATAADERVTDGAVRAPAAVAEERARVSAFDSELEPLQFSRLDTGHLVIFRNAWRDGRRYVQGILLDQHEFLTGATLGPFASGGLADGARLVASIGSLPPIDLMPASAQAAGPRAERLLYTARLSPPLAQIELAFRVGALPAGPAYRVLLWTAFVLAGVLLTGLFAIYRFGARQIALTRQQEDFVSAVSHELKTPLTSIRMYGEMLKSGWASDEKRQTYYDYIFAEGERLSRLIDNVLQIARLNRGSLPVALEPATVAELLDVVRSKVETAAERAGFALTVTSHGDVQHSSVLVDKDAFVQVFINLVDNAVKFARDADRREIVLSARRLGTDVLFAVRDFGPGIAANEMKRLFELFYRPDDERTRATSGTGIGLALVRQLVAAMHGRVDVRNCEAGVEFRLSFPQSTRVVD